MPDAIATPPAPVAPAPAPVSVPTSGHERLSADLDTILSGSGLGSKESEERVADTKRGHRPTKPSPKVVDKPAEVPKPTETPAGSDKTATPEPQTEVDPKAPEVSPDTPKAGNEKKKDPGPWARTHIAERRVKELETKLAEFESRPKSDDPEKLEWVKRYEDLDKRYKAKDEEWKYRDYTQTDEFQEKHYKPYEREYQKFASKMMSWPSQNEDGSARQTTAQDFTQFMGFSADQEKQAKEFALKLFGSEFDAARAMMLREKVMDAEENMRSVAAEFRKTGMAKQQEQAKIKEAQEKADYEQAVAQWENLNKGALEKYPDWFTAPDDDEKGKEFLKIGYENVDKALGAENGMAREEILARRAAVRNQAGAFRYMVHKWEAEKALRTAAEKELAAFKESEPGKGTIAGGNAAPTDDAHASIDASIARLAGR